MITMSEPISSSRNATSANAPDASDRGTAFDDVFAAAHEEVRSDRGPRDDVEHDAPTETPGTQERPGTPDRSATDRAESSTDSADTNTADTNTADTNTADTNTADAGTADTSTVDTSTVETVTADEVAETPDPSTADDASTAPPTDVPAVLGDRDPHVVTQPGGDPADMTPSDPTAASTTETSVRPALVPIASAAASTGTPAGETPPAGAAARSGAVIDASSTTPSAPTDVAPAAAPTTTPTTTPNTTPTTTTPTTTTPTTTTPTIESTPAPDLAPPVDAAAVQSLRPGLDTTAATPVIADAATDGSLVDAAPETALPAPTLSARSDAASPPPPAARLAEHLAVRELVDRVDKHRLASTGTLELEIATERFGSIRVEAIDGRDGVQLSLRGDGSSGRELAALAAELRQSFERDGQQLAGLTFDQGDGRPNGRDHAGSDAADDVARVDGSDADPTTPIGGPSGLDLRL